MLGRRTTGSVVCPSCGSLVGVNDESATRAAGRNPGLWGFAPVLRQLGADFGFVPLVVGASPSLYVLTLLHPDSGLQIMGGGIRHPRAERPGADCRSARAARYPVFGLGSWWTVLSATWLHGSLLHIVFNMMWVRDIGPSTADVIGPARTVIIYVVSGVCGFLLSSVAGAFLPPLPLLARRQLTVGASASISVCSARSSTTAARAAAASFTRRRSSGADPVRFGLIMPGDRQLRARRRLPGGYFTSAFFNPLTRERGDHLLLAGRLPPAHLRAIAMSIFEGWSFLFS